MIRLNRILDKTFRWQGRKKENRFLKLFCCYYSSSVTNAAGWENGTLTAKSRFLLKTDKVIIRFHSFEWIQVVNQAESTLDLVCGRGLLQRKAAEPQNLSHKSQQNITVLRMKARKAGWHSPSPISTSIWGGRARVAGIPLPPNKRTWRLAILQAPIAQPRSPSFTFKFWY